jgi:hypothetical protein
MTELYDLKEALETMEAHYDRLFNTVEANKGYGVPGMISQHWLTELHRRIQVLTKLMQNEEAIVGNMVDFLIEGDLECKDYACRRMYHQDSAIVTYRLTQWLHEDQEGK